jgi:hypothetical protein
VFVHCRLKSYRIARSAFFATNGFIGKTTNGFMGEKGGLTASALARFTA